MEKTSSFKIVKTNKFIFFFLVFKAWRSPHTQDLWGGVCAAFCCPQGRFYSVTEPPKQFQTRT